MENGAHSEEKVYKKKPNDPLLCRKKESNRGFEVPKKPDNVFEEKNYFLVYYSAMVIKKKTSKVWK